MSERSRPAGVRLTDAGGALSAALRAGARAFAGVHAHQGAQHATENSPASRHSLSMPGRERISSPSEDAPR